MHCEECSLSSWNHLDLYPLYLTNSQNVEIKAFFFENLFTQISSKFTKT